MSNTTYDASTDGITGEVLMIFVNGLPIAFGTSCGLDLSADSIDTANKMSGNWKESLAGQLGYSISSDSLLSKKAGHMSFKTLKSLMVERKPIEFTLGEALKEEDNSFTKGAEWYKGKAFITALSMKADNGAVCTSSITLTGSAALEDGGAESGG